MKREYKIKLLIIYMYIVIKMHHKQQFCGNSLFICALEMKIGRSDNRSKWVQVKKRQF